MLTISEPHQQNRSLWVNHINEKKGSSYAWITPYKIGNNAWITCKNNNPVCVLYPTKQIRQNNTTMTWPKEKWQKNKYYHDLTRRKMTTRQILLWSDQKKNDNKTNTTMIWPEEKWQKDKYYLHLTKRKMTTGQILPWSDQKKNDNKTNTTMIWRKEKWQKDKYYLHLTKRKMTTGQILPSPDQKKNDNRTNTTMTWPRENDKRTNTTMTWPKEKWQQDKYYHDLTKRKMTTGQILPWPDQEKNDKRTNTTMTWPKEKWQQNKQRSTKHTKDRDTRTPQKRDELKCHGR